MTPQPTTTPTALKILLDPEQSEILSDTGHSAFLVLARASYPQDPKRWILHIVPTSMSQASAACRVALGESNERRIATRATAAPSSPLAP